MNKLGNPVPIFLDARGGLLDGGKIYVGTVNADPQASPISVYWDRDLTILAEQPLRTSGGYIVNGGQVASAYFAEDDYSMRLCDNDDAQIFYSPTRDAVEAADFQPLDADLTAISAQGTTAYGRSLLGLVDQAALKTATGIPAPLPNTGGTIGGSITRQGAGVYTYFADPAMTSGRIFITAAGAADPTSAPGDLWLERQ